MGSFRKIFRKLFKRKRDLINYNDRSTGGGLRRGGRNFPSQKNVNAEGNYMDPDSYSTNPQYATYTATYTAHITGSISPHLYNSNYASAPVAAPFNALGAQVNAPPSLQINVPLGQNDLFDPLRAASSPSPPASPRKNTWPTPSRPVSGRRDWRSGYKPIDSLVQDIRLRYPEPEQHLSWIPFDEFVGHRFVARGGHSAIYQATWLKTGQRIALKCLDDSGDISQDYLDQIKRHWAHYAQSDCLRVHGITQLPDTGEFMLVIQYAPYGNLRIFFQQNRMLGWKEKINILKSIACSLAEIHKRGFTHGDIHSGNILNIDGSRFVITDLGTTGPANRVHRRKGPYGVLPYVAPEVLAGHDLTQKSDVFAFGLLMWELSSGMRPYAGRPHDYYLAKEIYEGGRPPIVPGTPPFFEELMCKCWESNPRNRPDAQEILQFVFRWLVNDRFDDATNKKHVTRSFNSLASDSVHPEAIYHSRLLEFPNLRHNGRKPVASAILTRSPIYDEYTKGKAGPDNHEDNYLDLPGEINDDVLPKPSKDDKGIVESSKRPNNPRDGQKQLMSIYITEDEISTVTAFWASESMPPMPQMPPIPPIPPIPTMTN